jgi:two-component system CheB/CheR fusion protein
MSSTSSATSNDRPVVVGLGGSAGGVDALQHFFDAVPEDSGLTFVVVMHLAPEETSHLAEVLQDHTSMPVTQVTEPTVMEADHVYVTAPGRTLLVEETTLVPHELEGTEERRTPIDRFFRSLAGASVEPMGVVLSGAGTDGSIGLRAITEAGGVIAAQDPSEAAHASMPRSAIETSRVDFVLPVADLARRLSEQRAVLRRLDRLEDTGELDQGEEEILNEIFQQVRARTGHDFSEYKQSTMLRRIQRRLQVHQIASLDEYLNFLDENPSEATALQKDLLISVTSFFRNPEAFAELRDEAIAPLLTDRGADDQIRAWCVGCATGEEAYSVAMLLLEQAESTNVRAEQIQVFASDLDEGALATARDGRYPEPIAADVPDRYLDRFFRQDGSEYVVRDAVRERILFTPHNLLRDPPFSKLDLITCRNLLIYLRRDLQVSVFDLFSYALNDDGFLFLGSSESADVSDENFRAVNKTHRLYRRREGERTLPELPTMPLSPTTLESRVPATFENVEGPSEAVLHRRMLEAYAPPSAIVDEDYQFVHLSQTAGRYLQHPGGTPNENIVEVVRPDLRVKLRSALRQAFAREAVVQTEPVTVAFNGESSPVHVIVRPARDVPGAEGMALVIFAESEEGAALEEGEVDNGTSPENGRVRELEQELKQTKKELRATVEEHETSKQEMRAANEELRSMNEEYKSMTEELETSKEELQSVNEELKTVNRELEDKVEELREVNSDLKNLMAATDIGTLFLDRELCIKRYTPRIEDLFNIRDSDVDRPIDELTHHLDYDTLQSDAEEVLDTLQPVEREVESEEGGWFLVRYHPYRTVDDRIEGVVITFVDITRRLDAENDLREANASLTERTQQVQALSEALTSAEETERKRMSQVLHDDLQQTIFAARMRVNHLEERSDFTEEQMKLARRAIELLDEGIETTRNLSSELNPPVGDQSLRDSLEWLAVQMQESYDLAVELKSKRTAKTTDKNLRHLLFRLVRELLFNVVKHAEVEEAFVFLAEGEDRLRIVVEDEGAGFDPTENMEDRGGLGLVSARERLEMIGGTFEVDAAPGDGTRIAIEVPWSGNGQERLPQA